MKYPSHPNQIKMGYVPPALPTGIMGEINPRFRKSLNMEHGRELAGLGRSEGWDGDSDYDDHTAQKLEKDDDVVGSGIFDAPGSTGTVHVTLGVFRDHPNLPGYIDREIPFRPSTEIDSIPSGAEVIVVPGGGMTWGGRLIGGGVSKPLVPHVPTGGGARPAPMATHPQPVPMAPATDVAPMGSRPVLTGGGIAGQLRVPQATVNALAPAASPRPVPVNTGIAGKIRPTQPISSAVHGFGAETSGGSVMPYVVGGALLGAAFAVYRKYVQKK